MRAVAGMATIPGRERACKEALNSLLGQVDEIHLSLNRYPAIPDWIPAGVNAVLTDGGDEEKFRGCATLESGVLFFSCDDDLIYPPNYVARTRAHVVPGQILTYHGRILTTPVTRFYLSGRKVNWFEAVPEDTRVHVGGTGVMAFRIQDFRPHADMFPREFPLMADIHVAVEAQRRRIPIRALSHPAGWIRPSDLVDPADGIYVRSKDCDARHVERLNHVADWRLHG